MDWECSTPEDIANVGERFLLKLYGAIRSTKLDKLRFVTSCSLDLSVDHLCHQGSNLSHCRQLSQPPSIPFLSCSATMDWEQFLPTLLGLATQGREFSPTHYRSASSAYTCVANLVVRLQDRLSEDVRMPEGRDVLFTHVQSL